MPAVQASRSAWERAWTAPLEEVVALLRTMLAERQAADPLPGAPGSRRRRSGGRASRRLALLGVGESIHHGAARQRSRIDFERGG